MSKITSMDNISDLKDNYIIGEFEFINSEVSFNGINNILLTPQNLENNKDQKSVKLKNAKTFFKGNNNLCFLNANNSDYSITLDLFNNSFCYIGENNFMNARFDPTLFMQCSEQCNIFIGDHCLFSTGIYMRTSDAHLIYDIKSHKRINPSKSIFIGDHVWIGQNAAILKGTHIGSGSIIGANAVLAGKNIPSNTLWGGNPATLIKRDVFFHRKASLSFVDNDTEYWDEYFTCNEYVYEYDENCTLDFNKLEHKIKSLTTAQERAEFLLGFHNKEKNRFYIG